VREKYGRIDVLYVNAGIAKLGSVAETTEQVFDDIFDANFRGAYFTVQKALPILSNGGAVVFTTSWFDEAGITGTSAVSASKAALRNLTRTLASELIGRNIRVNAVSPGGIETPLFGKLGLPEANAQEPAQALLQQIRRSASASRRRSPQPWHSLPPTMPPTSRASSSRRRGRTQL
jgi:NAD(P)-dependent dehydrogenase (short-subunit alcohol dehydrogenase family)